MPIGRGNREREYLERRTVPSNQRSGLMRSLSRYKKESDRAVVTLEEPRETLDQSNASQSDRHVQRLTLDHRPPGSPWAG